MFAVLTDSPHLQPVPIVKRAITGILIVCFSGNIGSVQAQDARFGADSMHVAAVLAAAKSVPTGEVWPGYTGPREFVVCSRDTHTILALREPPPAGIRASLLNASSDTTASIFILAGILPELQGSCVKLFNWRFDGRVMFAFPAVDSVFTVRDAPLAFTAVLFHEGFHLHQMGHFESTHEGPDALSEPPTIPWEIVAAPRFQRLAFEERLKLAEALHAEDPTSLRSLLAEYVELRRARRALLSSEQNSAEDHNERK
jgi:hypothetical protein